MLVSIKTIQNNGFNSTEAKKLAQENLGPKTQRVLGFNDSEVRLEEIDRSKGRAIRGIIAPKGYEDPSEILFFQFNPDKLSDSKGTDWFSSRYLGFSAPQPMWVGGQDRTIRFDLFFDATSESNSKFMGGTNEGYDSIKNLEQVFPNGVMDVVEKLQGFQYPISKEKPRFVGNVATPSPKFEAPPILIFCFGPFYMECALTSLDVSYDLFDKQLIPRRATCSITLTVYEFDRIIINSALPKVTSQSKAYY